MAYHQLPKLEQLNVEADALAQQRTRRICATNTIYRSTSLPFNHCKINLKTTTLGNKPICSMLMDSLRQSITQKDLREYWVNKKDLSNVSHKVNWNLRIKSILNTPKNHQRWL